MANVSTECFNDLLTHLTNLTYRRTKGDVKLIEKAIDELNALDYRYPITKAILLINQCCTLVYPDNEDLVSKCCQLIVNFILKQHVQIEGKTCSVVINWCLEALRQNSNVAVITDLLTALEMLLRSNNENVYKFSHDIVNKNSVIIKIAKDKTNPPQMLLAVQCLEACTIFSDDLKVNKNDFEHSLSIFTNYLMNNNKEFDEIHRAKLLIPCLGGLQNILRHDNDYLKNEIGSILGIVRSYMLYGVRGVDFIEPQKLMPSVSSVPEPTGFLFHEKRGSKVTKQRKPKSGALKKEKLGNDEFDRDERKTGYRPATAQLGSGDDFNLSSRSKFTDSDVSDAEADTKSKLSQLQSKVRLRALNIFYDITRLIDRRTLFSYSVNFIPDGWPVGTHSLTSCVLRDPSRTGRIAALNVLLSMLVESKLYLIQAESSDKNTPFTTFSITLGSMLVELHRSLRLALNERMIPVLTQVLKCFAALVQATPYHRLKPGLLTRNVRSLKPFLHHKDGTIHALTLIVLGCILASDPVIPEAAAAFSKGRDTDDSPTDNSESSVQSSTTFLDIDYAGFSSDDDTDVKVSCQHIPWMLKHCLNNLGVIIDDNGDCTTIESLTLPPVKLESLQVITAMSSNYFTKFVAPYLPFILKALELSLENKNMDVRLHAGRTINFIGQGICLYFTNNTKRILTIEQGLAFWNGLLSGPLTNLIEHDKDTIRAVACDCLASIGEEIFECLSKDKQMLVMMTLLACSKDKEPYVTSAAIRALGVSISYPSLREDLGFVTDTIEAILRGANDENTGVQVRAYWALGNVSETLVLNSRNSNEIESLPKSLWVKLFQCGIKGSEDHYKYKTNAVRALGNFVLVRNEEDFSDDTYRSLIRTSTNCLVKCAQTLNAKVGWNACYALGKVVKNKALYLDNTWQTEVFRVLLDLVVTCKNFKVRINAALALSCLPARTHYGDFFNETWIRLLSALENSENMEDFTEYKHRDHLVDQVCLSIGKLCSILEQSDLNSLSDCMRFYEDLLKGNMQKVYRRLVPEKTNQLLAAEVRLRELTGLKLSSEQGEVVKILHSVFNSEILKE